MSRNVLVPLFFFLVVSSIEAAKVEMTITSEPSGANIEMNGRFLGATPYSIPIDDYCFKAPRWLWSKFLGEDCYLRVWKEGYFPKTLRITSGPFVVSNGTIQKVYYVVNSTSFHVVLEPIPTSTPVQAPPVERSERADSSSKPESKAEGSMGSGFLISKNGYVVTNYHVVGGFKTTEVGFPVQNLKFKGKIELKDVTNDLAILKLEGFNSEEITRRSLPICLAAQNTIKVGQETFTLGFPLGDLMGSHARLSTGLINSLYGLQDDPRVLQIDNPMQPGNSGGPLFNRDGDLVGVVFSGLNAKFFYDNAGVIPQNVNFAVKVGYLKNLIEMLPDASEILGRTSTLRGADLQKQVEEITPFIVKVVSSSQDQAPASRSETSKVPVSGDPTPSKVATRSSSPSTSSKAVMVIKSNPPKASVFLNESFMGITPITLSLSAGKYKIRLFLYGYTEWSKEITVAEESEENLDIELKK